MKLLRYSEMIQYSTFEERFEYLNLHGHVGAETFGLERYLNQRLYHSSEWRRLRHELIVRDDGCDLAVPNREIYGPITLHHINPINSEMIVGGDPSVFDPENIVCVSSRTHNAIHYGSYETAPADFRPRTRNDTCPWREG